MKNRAATLAFTACLASSLAFADNPTDAPVVSNNGYTTAVQQESCKDHTSDQRHDKKDKSLSFKRKPEPEHPSHNHREGSPGNPEYPASMNNWN
jgi:hypothetical protein